MRAIVLSGGGAKGAYQMGVWKALKKLRIKYDIVTGTSVGAMNGALMINKNFNKAINLWSRVNFGDLFEEVSQNSYDELKKQTIKNKGLKTDKLENLLSKTINPKKILRSRIDYGLVTVDVTKMKPLEIKKSEMSESDLVDYIIASASIFPAFKTKDIKNKKYVDGGYFDNLPINLAINMGATEVIAVDLKAVGFKQKVKKKIPTTYITPRNKITELLNFDTNMIRRTIDYGYNDTMKTYGKLDGNKFTFKKGSLDKAMIKTKTLEILDLLGYAFMLDDSKVYSIRTFNNLLKQKLELVDLPKVTLKNIDKFKNINAIIIKFIYEKMKEEDKNTINVIKTLFKTEYLMAEYLYNI